MADILIKGMDMPTMPETFKQAESVPYIDVRIFADGTAVTSKGERPYYTQYSAVPIPPHGRLIDAGELRGAMYHEAFEKDSDMQRWDSGCWIRYKMFEKAIETAPTVIEASEDGEQDGKL